MRKSINVVAGLGLLAFLAYGISSFFTAPSRVEKLCQGISVGMSIDELNTYARHVGLSPPVNSGGGHSLVEDRSFGRYGCRVDIENGKVMAVRNESRS